MNERLTDAELDGLEAGAKLGELVYCEEILPLVAEVREHRAARTLGERERERVADATIRLESDGDAYPLDMRYMLAIIDRITENQP